MEGVCKCFFKAFLERVFTGLGLFGWLIFNIMLMFSNSFLFFGATKKNRAPGKLLRDENTIRSFIIKLKFQTPRYTLNMKAILKFNVKGNRCKNLMKLHTPPGSETARRLESLTWPLTKGPQQSSQTKLKPR